MRVSRAPEVTWHCHTCGMPNLGTSPLTISHHSYTSSANLTSTSLANDTTLGSVSSPGPPIDMSSPVPPKRKHQGKYNQRHLLRVLNVNCRSVTQKHGQFQHMVDSLDPDIIVATETWLKPCQADGEIGEPGRFSSDYNIHRRDRGDSGWGGVFIAVKSDIKSTRITELEPDNCELAWVKISINGGKDLHIGAYYRPHVSDSESLALMKRCVYNLANQSNSHLWVLGDFNLPYIDWNAQRVMDNASHKEKHQSFLDLLSSAHLAQTVKKPTRGKNVLDLFVTSNETLVSNCQNIPGISDHDAVSLEVQVRPQRSKQPPRQVPLWDKADWIGFGSELENMWLTLGNKNDLSVNELWEWLKSTISAIKDRFIPHKTLGKKSPNPWISKDLKRRIHKKSKLYKRKRRYPNRKNIEKYREAQNQVQRQFRREYWNYVNNLFSPTSEHKSATEINQDKQATDNKKSLWSYIKQCKQDSIGVAPLRDTVSGKLFSNARDKAELLNRQFQSVFSKSIPSRLGQLCQKAVRRLPGRRHYPAMPDFNITENGVLKLLHDLNPKKAPGPDNLAPRLLRELRNTLAPILTELYNRSLLEGKLPDDWKTANVVPIYKKGSKHLPSNYRPVSLTCICSKMLEHIVVSQITSHLDRHSILSNNQHGFRKGRSCETQLLDFVHDLHNDTIKGGQVDAVVMDFAKAFDKVSHDKLLLKMDMYGIQGKTSHWVKGFLSARTQKEVLEGETSGEVPVTSGVPQGSVLGPTLFLIFINDIADGCSSPVRLFADDTIIYRHIRTPLDNHLLQSDLSTLEKWSNDWQMEFHPSKCKTLHITRSKSKATHYIYQIYNTDLEAVKSAQYLGVHISSDLRWSTHVQHTANSANTGLRMLKRNLRVGSTTVKTRAYQAYIRPRLEYASTVWDPHTQVNKNQVEMVQRRAARWVLGWHHNRSSVSDMLQHLGWRSLETRRADSRLTMFYKMRNGLVALNLVDGLITPSGISASAHPHRYVVPRCPTVSQQHSFLPNTTRQWNALPSEVALAPTLPQFKVGVCSYNH